MQELFNKLRPILSQRNPDVQELHTLRYELAEARAKALQELYEARPTRLRPKDRDWTDLDRRVEMKGFTAELEYNLQFLNDLWDIVSDIIHDNLNS
ncbi:MAG TPA: hypothetical protein VGF75_07140 [Candidatus Saccharimonadales bacterium]